MKWPDYMASKIRFVQDLHVDTLVDLHAGVCAKLSVIY